MTLLNAESEPWSDWLIVFEWIRDLTEHMFKQHGLRLQGEVWYQGEQYGPMILLKYDIPPVHPVVPCLQERNC